MTTSSPENVDEPVAGSTVRREHSAIGTHEEFRGVRVPRNDRVTFAEA